jgi:DNA topoisomerase-1
MKLKSNMPVKKIKKNQKGSNNDNSSNDSKIDIDSLKGDIYLFIVESPGKIKKIQGFLPKSYIVDASIGHIRDLQSNTMSIDIEHNFTPIYVVTKPDKVQSLSKIAKKCKMVYLATDMDREGEAIAAGLVDELKLKNYKRVVFNNITKDAILSALKNPLELNQDLVNAQVARRVLDRLVGYEISPILQKIFKGSLSAGRVQSPCLRLVVDKENEIKKFLTVNKDSPKGALHPIGISQPAQSKALLPSCDSSFFKISGQFLHQTLNMDLKCVLYESSKSKTSNINNESNEFKGKIAHIEILEGDEILDQHKLVIDILKKCLKSEYTIWNVSKKKSYRNPSPPFITSTLQQEASKRFGYPIQTTMQIAQKLYEGGFITYMRTDSVELSIEAHTAIKSVVIEKFGQNFYQKHDYENKSKNAQEAHEAIRPTHFEMDVLPDTITDESNRKLYNLIWKRTVASQMKAAEIDVYNIQMAISKLDNYYFQSQIEKIVFPGFMKIYKDTEESDDTNELNELNELNTISTSEIKLPKKNDKLLMQIINAKQEFLKPPVHYTEASIVKKLEELGIGRPATYVSILNKLFERNYIKKGDVEGIKKEITNYHIKSDMNKHIMKIFQEDDTIFLGKETNKIIATDLGTIVNNFLLEHFPDIMDYQFTAQMEDKLDDIAQGKLIWHKVIKDFYKDFHPIVESLLENKNLLEQYTRIIGEDEDGNKIEATMAKYGPVVRRKIDKKYQVAPIKEPYTIETITLNAALELFKYPKIVGEYKNEDILLQRGKYGFYLIYKKDIKIPVKDEDISLEDAIELIKDKESNIIKELSISVPTTATTSTTKNGKSAKSKKIKVKILNGPYGPYLQIDKAGKPGSKKKKTNYKIPQEKNPNELTEEEILEIINTSAKKTGKKFFKKKK